MWGRDREFQDAAAGPSISAARPHILRMPNADEFACPDIRARNERMARWAGRLMGFSGPWLDAYVEEVATADYDSPGHDDFVAKIAGDFRAHGVAFGPEEIRRRLVRVGA